VLAILPAPTPAEQQVLAPEEDFANHANRLRQGLFARNWHMDCPFWGVRTV
jgi:hypothetical protein